MKTIFTFLSLVLLLETTAAQIFVSQNASGANDGSSWANAFTDIQAALNAANSGDQIWIAEGIYIPDGPTPDSSQYIAKTAVEMYGGFSGTESSIEEREWEIHMTIINGDKNGDDDPDDPDNFHEDNAHHMLIFEDFLEPSIIDGIMFTKGTTRTDTYAPDSTDANHIDRWAGGALAIVDATAIVRNCTFVSNYGYRGAAIFARSPESISEGLVIENCRFERNKNNDSGTLRLSVLNYCALRQCTFTQNTSGPGGGAVTAGNLNIYFEQCEFTGNTSTSLGGACFFFHNALSLISHQVMDFKDCLFTGNNSNVNGGAIRLSNFDGSFSFLVDQSDFVSNAGINGYGGAIDVQDFSDPNPNEDKSVVQITSSGFNGNASRFGAGMMVAGADDSLAVTIANSDFSNNVSAQGSGGGLYIYPGGTAVYDVQLNNVNFIGNRTNFWGAGIQFDSYNNLHPMRYTIDHCLFSNNECNEQGGAITSIVTPGNPGCFGVIKNSAFNTNLTVGRAGAIYSLRESLTIENCQFNANHTMGISSPDYPGGGALLLDAPESATITNTIFNGNNCVNEGGAILVLGGNTVRCENVLFHDNSGNSTVSNSGQLQLINSTFSDNASGLYLDDGSTNEIQNSIFASTSGNLRVNGTPQINSNGGNISNDASMASHLTGFGSFPDVHQTDPLLGPDYVPLAGSPAIDVGNPQGLQSSTDLAGNPRIMGGGIDIGSFETFSVATKPVIGGKVDLQVSPNPAVDLLQIVFDGEIESLGLMTLDGKVIKVDRQAMASRQINILDLVAGTYILNLQSAGKSYSTQFCKL